MSHQATPQFSPLHVNDHTLIEQSLRQARIGRGTFQPGEVYWQQVHGGIRPVLLTLRNDDGSVEGWYLGAVSKEEHDFGIGLASLTPAKWNDPENELITRTSVSDTMLKTFIERVFRLDSRQASRMAPRKELHRG